MNSHKYYFLNENVFLKLIDFPAVYNIKTDELYCLDENALEILKKAQNGSKIENKELLEFCLNEKILTEKPVKKRRPLLKQSPVPSLRYLELQITKRCNLKCRHCFIGKSKPLDLPFEKIVNVLKEFEEMQGLRVLITGGEPLMHQYFDRINEILKDFAFRKILFTNGTLLDEKTLRKLNVEEIQFSIDGMKKGHEALRGKGSFDKTLKALKNALDFGFDVSVATVIHKQNIDELDKLEKFIKNLNIREWTVDALTMTGNLKQNKEFWINPQKAGSIMNKYGFLNVEHPRAEEFGCGMHLIAVTASGKVAFCSFFEEQPIGNVEDGLENLWKKKTQILLKELDCAKKNCPFLEVCRGGCRFRAMILSEGNINAPDLVRCFQFGFLPQV